MAKVAEVTQTATTSNGAVLFKVCSSCHGQNGEKAALGKSQIIKGWDASKVETALKGYKDGTYGGVMKGLMKSQVNNLSDADIKALGEHISKL
ncbi:MAG: c-type cytochrome [Campylobacterales bacterium]|nr:c-type cytochrome [Campylobacterales bacterium]